MADIGKLAVQMSVNPGSFHQDMQKAADRVQSVGKQIASVSSGNLGFSAAFANLPGTVGIATTAILGLGASLKAAGADGIAFMNDVRGLSNRFQINVTDATNLTVASQRLGVETEAVQKAFGKMELTIGKAAEGSAEAQRAFDRLGLDFQQLMAMGPDKAFALIGDSLRDMGSTAERTAAAQAIFGKSWGEVDKLLRGGSAALADAGKFAEKFGLNISKVDLKNLSEMKQTSREVGLAFDGLSLSIGRALLPILTMLNKATLEVIAALRPFFDVLGSIITTVGSGLGSMGGLVQLIVKLAAGGAAAIAIVTAFNAVLAITRLAVNFVTASLIGMRAALISTGIGALIVGLGLLVDKLLSVGPAARSANQEIGDVLRRQQLQQGAEQEGPIGLTNKGLLDAEMRRDNAQLALQRAADAGDIDEAVKQANALKGINERIQALEKLKKAQEANAESGPGALDQQRADALEKDVETARQRAQLAADTLGMTRQEAEIFELESRLTGDMTESQRARIEGLIEELKYLEGIRQEAEQRLALEKEAIKVGEAQKSPIDKAQEEMARLQEMFRAGLLTLDQYDLAMMKVGQDLEKAAGSMPEVHGAGALEQGSSAAVAAVNAAIMNDQGSNDPQERVRAAIARLETVEQDNLREARGIRRALENNPTVAIPQT